MFKGVNMKKIQKAVLHVGSVTKKIAHILLGTNVWKVHAVRTISGSHLCMCFQKSRAPYTQAEDCAEVRVI